MKHNNSRILWIIIPAYNEATTIINVIEEVTRQFSNVVVVDDGSSDNTSELAAKSGLVHVLRHMFNLGQGAALQTGIIYALEKGADFIVTFDADGQHDINDVHLLISELDRSGVEVALGSRFLGDAIGMSRRRRILLKAAIFFTYFTTGLKLTDAHNGLRLLTRTAAKKINLTRNRMAHASELIEIIAFSKISFIEVPVTILYTDYSRQKGQRVFDAFSILFDLFVKRERK